MVNGMAKYAGIIEFIGSFRTIQLVTSSPNFHARYAEYFSNSVTVESDTQPAFSCGVRPSAS